VPPANPGANPILPDNSTVSFIAELTRQAIELAAAANAAYTGPQIVAYTYNTILQTGLFTDACRDWRCRPAAQKTWPTFTADFSLAHQEMHESQATTQGAGFHSANAALTADFQQQTFEALANLATATESDRSVISNLTDNNSALTTQLATTNAKLNTALADIAALRLELSASSNNNNRRNIHGDGNWSHNRNRNDNNRTPTVRKYFNKNYCWTHGYHIHNGHTSQTCRAPKDDHKSCATRANTMNGTGATKASSCGIRRVVAPTPLILLIQWSQTTLHAYIHGHSRLRLHRPFSSSQ
jgi:hypothetical protein